MFRDFFAYIKAVVTPYIWERVSWESLTADDDGGKTLNVSFATHRLKILHRM